MRRTFTFFFFAVSHSSTTSPLCSFSAFSFSNLSADIITYLQTQPVQLICTHSQCLQNILVGKTKKSTATRRCRFCAVCLTGGSRMCRTWIDRLRILLNNVWSADFTRSSRRETGFPLNSKYLCLPRSVNLQK